VKDLAITQSGDLVAWVRGLTTYATKVSFDRVLLPLLAHALTMALVNML
jgi:hypothetical protein